MTRIDKKTAAGIAGIHEKTLERYFHDQKFVKVTGYAKAANKRVTFDEQLFRQNVGTYFGLGEVAESGAYTDKPENFIEAENVNEETAMVKSGANTDTPEKLQIFKPAFDVGNMFLLPHKVFLTVKEAATISGLPQHIVLANCQKIGVRNFIHRDNLTSLCDLLKNLPLNTIPAKNSKVQNGNVGKSNVGKKRSVKK